MADKGNERILVVSDTHAPYHHKDLVRFLAAVKARWSPTRVIHIGDEVDFHGISFHDRDPDLLSPGHELENARVRLKPLFRLFPKVDVLESNHGSLVYRRGLSSGMPRSVLHSYREVLGAPVGWVWHPELSVTLPDNSMVLFRHGVTKDPHRWGKSVATHTVNGHFHEDFCIKYWRTPRGLFWSMVVGCLIDDKSRAYAYNKLNVHRPIYGIGLIVNSHPVLVPMLTNKSGAWTGKLA